MTVAGQSGLGAPLAHPSIGRGGAMGWGSIAARPSPSTFAKPVYVYRGVDLVHKNNKNNNKKKNEGGRQWGRENKGTETTV